MSDALAVYFEQRAPELSKMSPRTAKRYRLEKARVVKELQLAVGEDKPVGNLKRSDARIFRDHLIAKKLAISTVNKYSDLIKTIWKVAAQDQEIDKPNPFTDNTVEDPVPHIEKRSTLSLQEVFPASTYVAGFIGAPGMNMIKGIAGTFQKYCVTQ